MVIPPVEIAEFDVRRHSSVDRFKSVENSTDSDETTGRLY